jgi:hypothetical protein
LHCFKGAVEGSAIETCSADFSPGWHAALTAKI